jgi:hypothetical protein
MLDKLHLTSHRHINLDEASRHLEGRYTHCIPTSTKYHKQVLLFKQAIEGEKEPRQLLAVHTEPKLGGVSPLKIEVNPSRLESLDNLTELISLVCSPEDMRISRIDHCVDVLIDVRTIHQSLIFSRKKSREVYKQGHTLTGFYLGTFPERLAVYDKALEQGEASVCSRVELRQYGEKVPIRFYSDLKKLIHYKPFERLQFREVNDSPPQSVREATRRAILRESIEAYGAQGAYKVLNRHSNFRRDFDSLLGQSTNIPNLDAVYLKNIQQFLGKEAA